MAIARGRGEGFWVWPPWLVFCGGPCGSAYSDHRPGRRQLTELGNRLSDPRGTRPWIWAPVRQWPTLLWVVSTLRPLMWLTTGRMITLARPQVTGLVTRGLPGPRMNRCLPLDLGVRLARWVPSLALATLSVVVARAMSPCRRLILVLPPQSARGMFPWRAAMGTGPPQCLLVTRPPLTPPCPMGSVVGMALPLCRRLRMVPLRLGGGRVGRGRSRATVGL